MENKIPRNITKEFVENCNDLKILDDLKSELLNRSRAIHNQQQENKLRIKKGEPVDIDWIGRLNKLKRYIEFLIGKTNSKIKTINRDNSESGKTLFHKKLKKYLIKTFPDHPWMTVFDNLQKEIDENPEIPEDFIQN